MNEEEKIESLRVQGVLDQICLILDLWNRREITADEALKRFFQYVNFKDIEGAKKRFELRRSSVRLVDYERNRELRN